MDNKLAILIPENTYHIYNRANGSENIFLSEENYRFFMMKYKLYIEPIANAYCYCLMPNHFHFLIRIKPEQEIRSYLSSGKSQTFDFEKSISKQFSNFFSSYTQAFNKQQRRMGSLFMKNFKRKKVADKEYFKNLVYYIHYNPIKAKLVRNPRDYKYSSYDSIVNNTNNSLLRDELISFFNDLDNFIQFHENPNNFGKVTFEEPV